MKVKEGFLLKKIADDYVVIPYEDKIVDFKAMIVLNESGAFLWDALKCETTENALVEALLKEFDVDEETAKTDVKEFISTLAEKDLIDNE